MNVYRKSYEKSYKTLWRCVSAFVSIFSRHLKSVACLQYDGSMTIFKYWRHDPKSNGYFYYSNQSAEGGKLNGKRSEVANQMRKNTSTIKSYANSINQCDAMCSADGWCCVLTINELASAIVIICFFLLGSWRISFCWSAFIIIKKMPLTRLFVYTALVKQFFESFDR